MRRLLGRAFLLALLGSVAVVSSVRAAEPPLPDYFWPYGRALINGANLMPDAQVVIALVNGKACGESQTKVAAADPGNPVEDVGKTVYVVNVLAAGESPGHRPGCGRAGDEVTFYFPQSRAIADQHPAFQPGALRVNLNLTTNLANRLAAPFVSNDGSW